MTSDAFYPPDRMLAIMENVVRYQEASSFAVTAVERLQPVIDMMARMEPVIAALQRATEYARGSGAVAQQRDTITRVLANYQSFLVPTARELHETEIELRVRLPETPEQIEELEQAVAEVTADPEHLSLIERVAAGIRQADVASLTPWGLLILITFLLAWFSSMSGIEVSNDIGSLAIVVACAAIIQARK